MSHLLSVQVKAICRWTSVLLCVTCISGCVALTHNASDKAGQNKGPSILRKVEIQAAKERLDLMLIGDGGMKYSAVKQEFPLGVTLYLHETQFAPSFSVPEAPSNLPISSLIASYMDDEKRVAAINVLLREDLTFDVMEEGDGVRLSFFYPSASYGQYQYPSDDGQAIVIPNGGGGEPSSIETAFDGKETIDLDADLSPSAMDTVADTSSGVSLFEGASSRSLEAQPNTDLLETNALGLAPSSDAMLTDLSFQESAAGETEILLTTSRPIRYQVERSRVNLNELQLTLFKTVIPRDFQKRLVVGFDSTVAQVLPVNRLNPDSPSRILLQLKGRTPYHVLQDGSTLSLFVEREEGVQSGNARPFDPSMLNDFDAAAGSGYPSNTSDAIKRGAGKGAMDPNAPLPTHTALDPFAENDPVDSLGSQPDDSARNQTTNGETSPINIDYGADEDEGVPSKDETREDFFLDKPKVYTGEKISLDFYETDIKNVFRILRTVSGDNFAIDKDVTGNVTLTLDKPVPWDQILDLVLKMNGLGQVSEGSIIRIATLATLKKEEDARQALFEARKKSLAQKKDLEPLVTEYIPINYSNAETDIKPHLERLLKDNNNKNNNDNDRWQLTADSRTNMIILTAIQEKIDLAKEIIYRLDRVTPQIMISARIVEANKDFSRELGVSWNLSSEDVYRDDMGGLYGFDVAMNYPVNASNGLGYTFSRLAGTPFLLDAKLNASELTGDSKIISSPKILTMDNKTAKIDQGVDYGYQSGVDENGNPVISFKQATISLEVTPQVTPDNRVSMTVNISKNDIAGTVAGIPSLSTNVASTELLVNDGNTVVIGGIVKTNYSKSKNAFPLLGDLPYVGKLFSSKASTNNRDELMIFITPTIVRLDQRENVL